MSKATSADGTRGSNFSDEDEDSLPFPDNLMFPVFPIPEQRTRHTGPKRTLSLTHGNDSQKKNTIRLVDKAVVKEELVSARRLTTNSATIM